MMGSLISCKTSLLVIAPPLSDYKLGKAGMQLAITVKCVMSVVTMGRNGNHQG